MADLNENIKKISENAENNYNVSVSVEEYNDGYLYTIINVFK